MLGRAADRRRRGEELPELQQVRAVCLRACCATGLARAPGRRGSRGSAARSSRWLADAEVVLTCRASPLPARLLPVDHRRQRSAAGGHVGGVFDELAQRSPAGERGGEEQRILAPRRDPSCARAVRSYVRRQVDRRAAPVVAGDARGTLDVERQSAAGSASLRRRPRRDRRAGRRRRASASPPAARP